MAQLAELLVARLRAEEALLLGALTPRRLRASRHKRELLSLWC